MDEIKILSKLLKNMLTQGERSVIIERNYLIQWTMDFDIIWEKLYVKL